MRERARRPCQGKAGAPSSSTGTIGFFEVGNSSPSQDINFQVTLKQFLRKEDNNQRFVGLTTHSQMCIRGSHIGKPALDRLREALMSHGLQVRWSDKQAQARGIGGEAKVIGVVEIPVGVAGHRGH